MFIIQGKTVLIQIQMSVQPFLRGSIDSWNQATVDKSIHVVAIRYFSLGAVNATWCKVLTTAGGILSI